MTPEDNTPATGRALSLARDFLPDAVGLVGFGLFARGLWLAFGEPVALIVCGGILITLSVAAVLRGGR